MPDDRLRVLFLCTGNSARSQMAEALLRSVSRGRIDVFSAGSDPQPEIHPLTRAVMLRSHGMDLAGQEPKSWDVFVGEKFDFVITVCGRAAERCPAFPGEPERIEWHIDDPAAVEGSERERTRAFERAASDLMARIRIWLALPRLRKAVEGG